MLHHIGVEEYHQASYLVLTKEKKPCLFNCKMVVLSLGWAKSTSYLPFARLRTSWQQELMGYLLHTSSNICTSFPYVAARFVDFLPRFVAPSTPRRPLPNPCPPALSMTLSISTRAPVGTSALARNHGLDA